MFPDSWIAERTKSIELSGIRKVFELGKSLKDPVNLSIGQPHFDVPESIKAAAKAAIDAGHNGYSVTQGVPQLRDKLAADARGESCGGEVPVFDPFQVVIGQQRVGLIDHPAGRLVDRQWIEDRIVRCQERSAVTETTRMCELQADKQIVDGAETFAVSVSTSSDQIGESGAVGGCG